jgi:hypothetical protein
MPPERTWIARLTPTVSSSIDLLLSVPIGLDVWERHPDSLVVAATDDQLAELERRRLAEVERWSTREEFEARAARRHDGPAPPPTAGGSG